jgi:uncharacterized protein YdeI (YjbR/CyaY-like superfamily)
MEPTFFETPEVFRAWFEAHHQAATELSVGFRKRGSGLASITWSEAVDEALSFGWIDGVRHSIDAVSYRIRFTPRKPGGIWSQVNIKRFAELKKEGRIRPAGQAAYDIGKERTKQYSYEKPAEVFSEEEAKAFMANKTAWRNFEAFPPWYRKVATHRVTSAKAPATRAKRLAILIDASAEGRKLGSATK